MPGCALLTLNRSQVLNALWAALRGALVQTLHTLADEDTLRAMVLTVAGKAFCAMLDLS